MCKILNDHSNFGTKNFKIQNFIVCFELDCIFYNFNRILINGALTSLMTIARCKLIQYLSVR